jgi:alpha-beta hydrolase superfamily lysophospholipase
VTGRRQWPRRVVACVALASAGLVGIVLALIPTSTARRVIDGFVDTVGEGRFYALPDPVPAGAPGTLVRSERLTSTRIGAVAWRVLYHSTDQTGRDIVVSGVVVAPDAPVPAGGRAVVSWAHPTTGAAPRCASSNGVDPFLFIEGLDQLLAAGYVVAAADYPGLGVDNPSSYLIGDAEAASVLDIARVARQLPTGANADLLVWGHSQGGQAALFAGQNVRRYAPELRLRAVAVAAPAADLGALLDDHADDVSGVTLGSYAFAAYSTAYGVPLDSILTPAGVSATPQMAALCLFGQLDTLHAIATPLIGSYWRSDPSTTSPWSTLLTHNTPGAGAIGVPVFVAQGSADELVRPSATVAYVPGRCTAGEDVRYREYAGATHGTVALAAVPDVITFFADALAGHPEPSTCE